MQICTQSIWGSLFRKPHLRLGGYELEVRKPWQEMTSEDKGSSKKFPGLNLRGPEALPTSKPYLIQTASALNASMNYVRSHHRCGK